MHNLEHGAVILQYGDKVPQSEVAQITRSGTSRTRTRCRRAAAEARHKIALTAWTNWAECNGFNEKASNAFRKAFRYHAPESAVSRRAPSSPGSEPLVARLA